MGTKKKKILIDAGLSVKATKERLETIGVSLEEIDAILISHEHIDHIRGLPSLANKYQIPIFANSDTAKAVLEMTGKQLPFKIFATGETFEFGDLEVHPFSIQHDTLDPVAFTLTFEGRKLGFCTDLGFATTLVKSRLSGCDFLYIEANHEPSMVHSSSRPESLKARILGRQGHLSNQQCAELIAEIAHPKLQRIHLAHLSAECNHPDRALSIVREALTAQGLNIPLSIAHQDIPSQAVVF